jgi:hypothetical protein
MTTGLKEKLMATDWKNKSAMIAVLDSTEFKNYLARCRERGESEELTNSRMMINLELFQGFTSEGMRNHVNCLKTINGPVPWVLFLYALAVQISKADHQKWCG